MMKRHAVTLAALSTVLLFLAWSAHAARLEVSTGEPVEVYIAVGVPTVVTFPEKVRAIPTSADPEAVSLEAEGSRLFIQSLRAGFGATVFVIGESDRLHILKLTEREPPDTEVQLVLPKAPPRFGDEASRPGRSGSRHPRGSPLRRLLVALLKGEKLRGVEVLAHDQVLAQTEEVEIRTTHLYAAGRYLGFVGKATNLTAGPFVLRLPEYQAQGLKAIAADDETIQAGGETRVYLVIEPGSPY
ncbi:MAG: type-F conjugative transfer system secretin TraK [Candidatus Tectomicrobia bacterium]|nr:type-F conjugative transfer system secretin TraK [Candidatus Tectomicrobia bacterium]